MAQTPEIDGLWREVAARPHDQGLRAVLADALQAVEDPRGELIALQLLPTDDELAPDRARRIHEILAEHGERWLGAATPICRAAHFDRGVLDRFEIHYPWERNDRRWSPIIKDPPLETVEELLPGRGFIVGADNGPQFNVYRDLLRSPKLRRLRRVDISQQVWLEAIDERIEHVAFRTQGAGARFEQVIARLAKLPRITSLALPIADFEQFAVARWFERIESLTIASAVRAGLALWLRIPRHTTLAIVSYTGLTPCSLAYPWDYRVELSREADGSVVARISGEWLLAPMESLAALPRDVTHVEIEHTSDATAERLHAILAPRGIPIAIRRATWHGNLVRDAQLTPRRES